MTANLPSKSRQSTINWNSGAVLDIQRGNNGAADDNTFTINQAPNFLFFDAAGRDGEVDGSRINIDQSYGPLSVCLPVLYDTACFADVSVPV